ncbi:hypothetical protein K437DRAFT_121632 [Tilletiaria anomala UBC 951]|uniref:Pericentrin/AKAP-450 centrosomal targeting domain-containing protein n=1 Tax=Tilletiaria anomala (strain ATCC 24038 / CBS 436.72 / UBC 951) TaxID=1037660 RepID=A0A066VUR7_TILAU|nr:uncharacterized protein K437DRAFT_121632 [Tilletiaria anomala UBC 951]KDN45457.1 hypothetical protein K437DRAFT_121632 [Tilletiaria anomala UBC 951]
MMSKLIEKDQQIQSLAGDRDRLKEIRAGVLASIASLDEDLQKAKEQSVQYGEELAKLKAQREGERKIQEGEKRWLESIRTDAELALQRKVRELATMESKLASLEEEMTEHKCPSIVGLEDLHSKHSREAKGLMVQIRYLKTKFMRESDLRADMIHQKAYLTKLVGGLERNEAATLKFISDIGISRNIPPAAKYGASRFRQVALAVRAVSRMKLMSQRWQQTLRVRDAVREAHAAARNLK